MSNYYKFPIPSSRLTEIRKNRMLYADYISKIQANNQGCDTSRTGLEDGNVASGSIIPDLLDGARNTTAVERDAILLSTACSTIPAAVEPTYSLVTDGLQLYYNMGDTSSYPGSGTSIFDLSPNGFTGTLNGPTYSSADGGSLVFDGVDDYIDTNQSLGYNEFTLSTWFKCSNVSVPRMMFSKEETAGTPWNYRLYLNQTNGRLLGDIAKGAGDSSSIEYTPNLADGLWHMAAFSRNTTTDKIYLYLDGVEVSNTTDTVTAGSIINTQEVWIGRSAYLGGSYPFVGNIAATFIYNRPLTGAEVFSNYMATKTRFGL